MAKQTFRKESLKRLSSPEQLDLLMKVTTPKGWMALLALGGLQLAIIFWGFYGSISSRVTGQGMLIKSGGVFEVVSLSSGRLTEIFADVGETVEKGQIVARISQPDLVEQIKKYKAELIELKTEYKQIAEIDTKDIKMNREYMDNQRANLKNSIRFAQDRLNWLNQRLTNQRRLYEQGLIAKKVFLDTRYEINTTKEDIEKNQNQLKQISILEFQLKDQKERELRNKEYIINEKERELAGLTRSFDENSKVISYYTGRILEIIADEGKTISRGDPIMSLELVGEAIKDLEAVIYIASTEGKKVRPGMKAHISPSTVKQEEYGFMLGIVTHVAEFPSTSQGMMRILQNEALVQTLSAGGAPIQIYADLIPDHRTESGFKWSSPKGPPIKSQTGTICSATITVSEQPPIYLVIPFLKKLFVTL